MTEIEKLQEQVNSLQKQIDLMKFKKSEVKPLGFDDLKKNDLYWYIKGNDFLDVYFDKEFYDCEKILIGNAFRTEEEAEAYHPKYLRKLEILEWLHRNRDFEENCYINWNKVDNDPYINMYEFSVLNQYSLSQENANKAIELFGNDLKLIFDL